MQGESGVSRRRIAHQCRVTVVDGLAAQTVIEGDGEVETLECQVAAETSIEVWIWCAAVEIRGSCAGCCCSQLAGSLILHIPGRLAICRNSGIFLHAEGVHRQALTIEVETVYITRMPIKHTALIVFVEHRNLVLVMGGIEVNHPREVLVTDRCKVQIYLHTAVNHITHIVIRTGITSREWNIYEAEHIGGLATEVLDATRDAVLEEFKLDTRIEVAVGLPGNIRITHGVLHETYLAIEVAEIISIGISVVADGIVTLLAP